MQFLRYLFSQEPQLKMSVLLVINLTSFGYVVEGADFLQDVKEGDIIVSAKVTKGLEYLKQPKETA